MAKRIFTKIAGYTPNVRQYNLNITENSLKVNIVETYDSVSNIIADYELSLDVLKQAINLKSNSLISIIRPPSVGSNLVTTNNLINISSLTKDQRLKNSFSYNLPLKDYGQIAIFVKDINGTFNDHDIIIYGTENDVQENLTSNQEFELTETFNHLDLVDIINVSEDTSYVNDEYYKFNVSTASYVDEVYLEQVRGIIDKARVPLTAGNGHFRVLKSSVEAGDELKVRAGFASYVGLTIVTKTV